MKESIQGSAAFKLSSTCLKEAPLESWVSCKSFAWQLAPFLQHTNTHTSNPVQLLFDLTEVAVGAETKCLHRFYLDPTYLHLKIRFKSICLIPLTALPLQKVTAMSAPTSRNKPNPQATETTHISLSHKDLKLLTAVSSDYPICSGWHKQRESANKVPEIWSLIKESTSPSAGTRINFC